MQKIVTDHGRGLDVLKHCTASDDLEEYTLSNQQWEYTNQQEYTLSNQQYADIWGTERNESFNIVSLSLL